MMKGTEGSNKEEWEKTLVLLHLLWEKGGVALQDPNYILT
jgi:hypothetical protein